MPKKPASSTAQQSEQEQAPNSSADNDPAQQPVYSEQLLKSEEAMAQAEQAMANLEVS